MTVALPVETNDCLGRAFGVVDRENFFGISTASSRVLDRCCRGASTANRGCDCVVAVVVSDNWTVAVRPAKTTKPTVNASISPVIRTTDSFFLFGPDDPPSCCRRCLGAAMVKVWWAAVVGRRDGRRSSTQYSLSPYPDDVVATFSTREFCVSTFDQRGWREAGRPQPTT
jgi:hypothetical protein